MAEEDDELTEEEIMAVAASLPPVKWPVRFYSLCPYCRREGPRKGHWRCWLTAHWRCFWKGHMWETYEEWAGIEEPFEVRFCFRCNKEEIVRE